MKEVPDLPAKLKTLCEQVLDGIDLDIGWSPEPMTIPYLFAENSSWNSCPSYIILNHTGPVYMPTLDVLVESGVSYSDFAWGKGVFKNIETFLFEHVPLGIGWQFHFSTNHEKKLDLPIVGIARWGHALPCDGGICMHTENANIFHDELLRIIREAGVEDEDTLKTIREKLQTFLPHFFSNGEVITAKDINQMQMLLHSLQEKMIKMEADFRTMRNQSADNIQGLEERIQAVNSRIPEIPEKPETRHDRHRPVNRKM